GRARGELQTRPEPVADRRLPEKCRAVNKGCAYQAAGGQVSSLTRRPLPGQKRTFVIAITSRTPHRCYARSAAMTFGDSWSEYQLNRDSLDESQTGINVRVFPALLQDRREVLTATSTSDNPNAWSRV